MIRLYRDEDCQAVLDIWERASRVGHPFFDDAELARQRHEIEVKYIPMADQWVFEIDGELAGFIAMIGSQIGGLFIDPPHHRKGLATALIDHVRKMRPNLTVEVFVANQGGRAFYSRYGFVETAVHPDPGVGLPVVVCKLSLTDQRPAPPADR